MKAISIKPPWAWAIIHGGKDIENRTWATRYRGPLLIHAGKAMTRSDYERVVSHLEEDGIVAPHRHELERGGIIGIVELIDCVEAHTSPWFGGPVVRSQGRFNAFAVIGPCRGLRLRSMLPMISRGAGDRRKGGRRGGRRNLPLS
jgi:ASCH domain-containing protein